MSDFSDFSQIFPGISKIFIFDRRNLPFMLPTYAKLVPDPWLAAPSYAELPIGPDASLQTSEQTDPEGVHCQTELKFIVPEGTDIPERSAFLVVDANGKHWVIGAAEPPFPTIKREHARQAPGKNQSEQISVNWCLLPIRCNFIFY